MFLEFSSMSAAVLYPPPQTIADLSWLSCAGMILVNDYKGVLRSILVSLYGASKGYFEMVQFPMSSAVNSYGLCFTVRL